MREEKQCKKQFQWVKVACWLSWTKTEELNNMIQNINLKEGICEIANDNANGQIIISGDKDSVQSFQNLLKEKKIKSIPLKVSAPFHCSLMKPAAEIMKNKINKVKLDPILELLIMLLQEQKKIQKI